MPVQRTVSRDSYRMDPMGAQHQQRRVDGRRGPWSPQEDAKLKELVLQHGAGNWVAIQNGIGSRSAKQCRERWHQNLDPKLNHEPITPEEGAKIEELVAHMGKRWADIARALPGRSDNAVKNWWNGGENRRRREQSRQEPHYPMAYHHPQAYYPAPAPHWTQPSYQAPSSMRSYTTPGPQLAPLLTSLPPSQNRPSSIVATPYGQVSRDQPSPALSLPSMTEGSCSPRSTYTPAEYTAPSMNRAHSMESIKSSHQPEYRAELAELRANSEPQQNLRLPSLNSLLNNVPSTRELGHLIKETATTPIAGSPQSTISSGLPSWSIRV